jgi:hypothetical protein
VVKKLNDRASRGTKSLAPRRCQRFPCPNNALLRQNLERAFQ